MRVADHKAFDVYTFRVKTKERGSNFDGWNWLLNWIKPNGLSQLTEDIKPEMALWRERELIPLLCHESDSRAKKSPFKIDRI